MVGLFTRGWGYRKPPLGARLNRSHQLAQGLVGYWVMNEMGGTTLIDSAGINTGTLTNGPTWTAGQFGPTVNFDGANDSVNIADNPSLDLGNTGALVLWVNASDWANNPFLVAKSGGTNATTNYRLEQYLGTLYITLGNGTDFSQVGKTWAPATNTWYMVTGIWNGVDQNLYVDAALLVSAGSQAIVPAGNTNIVEIGDAINHSGTRRFTGRIDNVRIYNRALSPQEIRWLYQEPFADFQPVRRVFGNVAFTFDELIASRRLLSMP